MRGHAGKQVGGLLELEAAGDGRAGVGAQGRVQSVDVEGDVDLLRQRGDDRVALVLPRDALELLTADVRAAHHLHPVGVFHQHLVLLLAEIADAHAHDALHLFDGERVVQNAGMAVGEAFVGHAQVEMCIDVQDAEFLVAGRLCTDGAQRCAMVTAHQPHPLALFQPVGAALFHPVVHHGAFRIDAGEGLRGLGLLLRIAAVYQQVDHVLGILLQGLALLKQRFGQLIHVDPAFPQAREFRVEQVLLEAGLHDGIRTQ